MLARFIESNNLIVPNTGNRYIVDMRGNVTDTNTGTRLSLNETGKVVLDVNNESLELRPSIVVALAYKAAKYPPSVWYCLEVTHLDNDQANIHPGNLIWKLPKGGIAHLDGFYLIPGFSGYAINRQGDVLSFHVNRLLSPYIDFYGYPAFGINPDVGNRTIVGKHRLLALAFIPCSDNVDELDVNHVDGNKLNFDIGNLEWATRQWNCVHAYIHGLRNDNLEIEIMDSFTQEVTHYYSIQEVVRHTGMDAMAVRRRAESSGRIVYYPGIQIKFAKDPTPWTKYEDPVKVMGYKGLPRAVTICYKKTGVSKKFDTLKQAAAELGIKLGTLSWRLSKTGVFEDDEVEISKH